MKTSLKIIMIVIALLIVLVGVSIYFNIFGKVQYFMDNFKIIAGIHLFGVVLGFGGAMLSDIFFFKFLRDMRISEFEESILKTFSKIIWIALAIILISGIALFLARPEVYSQSSKFLLKVVVVSTIIVNGSLLNFLVSPQLTKISFGEQRQNEKGELRHTQKIAFALGAVSMISWFGAFILGLLKGIPISFGNLVLIYIAVLVVGILGSQIMRKYLEKKVSS